MRIRVLSVLLLAFAGVMTFSLTRGEDQTPTAKTTESIPDHPPEPPRREAQTPATPVRPLTPAPASPAMAGPARDFSKLGTLQQEMLVSCRRSADWLYRVNGLKGRFVHGYLPALKTEMEGDNYLRQAGAAFALARAARFLGEERYAARATQALLTLLDETVTDSSDPQCRHTALPSPVVNRLGAAGMLVLAVSELPAPQPDLLEKSEQLCNWMRRQTRADGSLRCNDASPSSPPEMEGAGGGRSGRRRRRQRVSWPGVVRAVTQPNAAAGRVEDGTGPQGDAVLPGVVDRAPEHGLRAVAERGLVGSLPADQGADLRGVRL